MLQNSVNKFLYLPKPFSKLNGKQEEIKRWLMQHSQNIQKVAKSQWNVGEDNRHVK